MSPPPRPRRRSWWLVAVFLALLAVPTPTVAGALTLAAIASLGWRVARGLSARRRAGRELTAARADPARILLGLDDRDRPVTLSERQLAAHGLIVGASGAGKSTTLLSLLSVQIARGRAIVAIDLKGSPAFAEQLAVAAQDAGRPFRCWSADGQELWNPLRAGNAAELKDKLIATERFTEPHYQRAAERYVQLALQVLAADGEQPITLGRVVEVLEPSRLALAARELNGPGAQRIADYVSSLGHDQLSGVRGLASRLAILTESHTGALLEDREGNGIDLRRALAGEEVVLFTLNSSTYGRLAAQLGTLAVQDLVSAAGERLGAGVPVRATVAIDEFSALESANVLSLLVRGREAGISVVLATQELADLDRAARGMRDQVLGNTAVKIAHRQDVPASAETVARLAGTVLDWERSYSVSDSGPRAGEARQNLRQVERFLAPPERVRTLRTGEAVVIVKTPSSRTDVARILPARSTERDGRAL